MGYKVKYVKTGAEVVMEDVDLITTFSGDLSMHLIKLDCIIQASINSEKYGKILIRKE